MRKQTQLHDLNSPYTNAAGWIFKAASFAYSIWNGIQSKKQRKADMAKLSRYHAIEMAKLEQLLNYDIWSTARLSSSEYVDRINDHVTNLKGVISALEDADTGADDSDGSATNEAYAIFADRIRTFYKYADGDGNIISTVDNYGKCLTVGDNNGAEPLIPAYAKGIANYSGGRTPSFVMAQYSLAEIYRYQEALLCLAFYRQIREAFPTNTLDSITGESIASLDFDKISNVEAAKKILEKEAANHLPNIMEVANNAVWEIASDRFHPDMPSIGAPEKFYGWEENVHHHGDKHNRIERRVLTGDMTIPDRDSKADKPNAVVGLELVKTIQKEEDILGVSLDKEGLSLRLHYAAISDILNGYLTSAKKAPIKTMMVSDDEDADCDTRVDVGGYLVLGTQYIDHMSVAHIGSAEREGGKIRIVTGARLSDTAFVKDNSGNETGTFNELCLQLHMTTFDPETQKLADDGAWYSPPIDKGLHIITGRIERGDEGGAWREVWKDNEGEWFALTNAVQSPPTMLRGAILNHSSSEHSTNIDVYTYWPLSD